MTNLLITHQENVTDKNILSSAKIHWISYIVPVVFIFLGSIAFLWILINKFSLMGFMFLFGLPVILLLLGIKGLFKFFTYKLTEIYVTDRYLTITTGIFSKKTSDISLVKMEGVQLYQSFIGRILKYGDLTVSTGEITLSFKIETPEKFRKAILK